MESLTIDNIVSLQPCGNYVDPDFVACLSDGKQEITAQMILDCDALPVKHKLWVLCREPFLSDVKLDLATREIVRDALFANDNLPPEPMRFLGLAIMASLGRIVDAHFPDRDPILEYWLKVSSPGHKKFLVTSNYLAKTAASLAHHSKQDYKQAEQQERKNHLDTVAGYL